VIFRKDLLNRLLMVSPALAKSETLRQSSCVVLRKGRFYTMSQEISCSMLSGLPEEFDGAIVAEGLIKILEAIPDEEVDIRLESGVLSIKGKGRRTRMVCESEVVLPVDSIERPKVWSPLHPDFADAVDTCHRSTSEHGEFLQQCLHITPEYMEASDNLRVARYTLPTGLPEPILVKGKFVKSVVQLGMTKLGHTDAWLHFRSPAGLRVSVRKYAREFYPDFTSFLQVRGPRIKLPKQLLARVQAAGTFSGEKELVSITLAQGKLTILGRDAVGEHREVVKTSSPEDITFSVPYRRFLDLITRYGECEVGKGFLRAGNEKHTYLMAVAGIQ
jgi:hypothetical protein